MAIQTINVGLIANDGTGDDLREAFIKVNQNFDELDLRTGTGRDGVNVGVGGFTVFRDQDDTSLYFRALQVDPLYADTMGIRVSEDGDTLYLYSRQATYRITDGTSTIVSGVESVLTFTGTEGATVTVDNPSRTVFIDSQVVNETAPALSATLDADSNNIVNVGYLNDIEVAKMSEAFAFDFGSLGNTRTSIFDWFVNSVDVDFGTIITPADEIVDLGLLPTV